MGLVIFFVAAVGALVVAIPLKIVVEILRKFATKNEAQPKISFAAIYGVSFVLIFVGYIVLLATTYG